jgi:hypothetical protein
MTLFGSMRNITDSPAVNGIKARWWPWALALLGVALLGFVFWAAKQGWPLARAIEDAEPEFKTDRFTVAYAKWGTYYASLGNGILFLILAATWRWWGRPLADRPARVLPPIGKWGWAFLLISLVVGGWLRWERAGLSLYNDEAHTFKRYVAGDFRPSDQKWRQVPWLKTFFFNKVGNNSSPCSVLSRVSYETWAKATKAAPGAVSERAIRFPSIVASLLGCVLLWATARRLWGNYAAAAVAILSAVHFWMVRYGNEGRGYGLTLLGLGLIFYGLCRAWETPRWRWWLVFAVGQWLCLYSFSGSIYFILVLNLGLLGKLAWRVWKHNEPKETLLRPIVALTAAAMLTLQLMLPTLPQLVAAINALDSLKGPMGWPWFKDVVSGLSSGLSFEDVGGGHEYAYVLSQFTGRWVLAVSLTVLLVTGFWRVLRGEFLAKLICLAGLISIPLSWVMMGARELYLLPWYVICALPGILLLLAGNFAIGKGKARYLSLVAGIALVVSWLGVNHLLAGRPKESVRETYEFVRGAPDGANRLFGSYKSDVDAYDKKHFPWDSVAEFETLLEKARREHAELWIAYTREPALKTQFPAILARLQDPAEFQLVKTFPPMDEAQFTHYVLKWVGK